METHAERFRHLLEVWGLTQEELGSLCGIKRGTVGTIVNGKTTPDANALAELLRRRPDLSPDWLLTGTGPMLRDGRALSPAPAAAPAAPLRISQRPALSDEQASDLLIENARLQAELQAAHGIIGLKDSIIEDLKSDKSYYQDELRKKPEAPADAAAPLVRHPRASSMVPSACREQGQTEPEALMLAHVNEALFALGNGYQYRAAGAPESTMKAA